MARQFDCANIVLIVFRRWYPGAGYLKGDGGGRDVGGRREINRNGLVEFGNYVLAGRLQLGRNVNMVFFELKGAGERESACEDLALIELLSGQDTANPDVVLFGQDVGLTDAGAGKDLAVGLAACDRMQGP